MKEILKNTEGVGEVDVMIVLKSSEEKVLHVDQTKSRTSTEEEDSAGGKRKAMSEEVSGTSVFSENGSEKVPVIEKELRPEIEGIVVSAQGGGNAAVRAEISEAMEALFNIPAHKIKVLKRVD
ncbi:putative stage III sporulation protein AG [Clostridium sp. CAG:149]|nr:putative stage III sporulation protein AG [Clostridium sp. CAG:149]